MTILRKHSKSHVATILSMHWILRFEGKYGVVLANHIAPNT